MKKVYFNIDELIAGIINDKEQSFWTYVPEVKEKESSLIL
jgi:hypothetical protein